MNEGAKDTFGTAAARRVPRIAVLVPCYNEAVTIAKVVDDFHARPAGCRRCTYTTTTPRTAPVAIAREHGATVRHGAAARQGQRRAPDAARRGRRLLRHGGRRRHLPRRGRTARCSRPLVADEADMSVGDRLSNGTYGEENDRAFHGFGNNLVRWLIKADLRLRVQGRHDRLPRLQLRVRQDHARALAWIRDRDGTFYPCRRQALAHRRGADRLPRPSRWLASRKLSTFSDGTKVLLTIAVAVQGLPPARAVQLAGARCSASWACSAGVPVVVEFMQTGLVPKLPERPSGRGASCSWACSASPPGSSWTRWSKARARSTSWRSPAPTSDTRAAEVRGKAESGKGRMGDAPLPYCYGPCLG